MGKIYEIELSGPIHPRLQALIDHKSNWVAKQRKMFEDGTSKPRPVSELVKTFPEGLMEKVRSVTDKNRGNEYIFFREGMFYIIELKDDEDAIASALHNEGTTRVEDAWGRTVWDISNKKL